MTKEQVALELVAEVAKRFGKSVGSGS